MSAAGEELLHGGVANAGAVIRVGGFVLRPANPNSGPIHRFLHALRAAGFDGACDPVGLDPDGRERLVFIPGEVAIPPYPSWVQTDAALASIAELMRRFHDASRQIEPEAAHWSDEMADPTGGTMICHNDVCLENVVFRDGKAVALLDFDFAALGHALHDLATMARMCVPIDDDESAARLSWEPADRAARLRLVADAYGLDAMGRHELIDHLDGSIARGGQFVQRRVAAGDANFVAMWESMGGMARFDRRRQWWAARRDHFAGTVVDRR